MFSGVQSPGTWLRRYRAVIASVGAHVALLALIVFRHPQALEITPTWLAWGNSDHSYRITYLPAGPDATEQPKLAMPEPKKRPSPLSAKAKKPAAAESHHELDANAEEGTVNTKAGSLLGRVVDGPVLGHEVHIALPVYPEPQVDRANLPRDLAGDVVIEVTIDSEGNVVATKVVLSIGHDIDLQIEAALRQRHYQPATLDGTPVASHQDVHFHFPS